MRLGPRTNPTAWVARTLDVANEKVDEPATGAPEFLDRKTLLAHCTFCN
jgi:hypothetical protein